LSFVSLANSLSFIPPKVKELAQSTSRVAFLRAGDPIAIIVIALAMWSGGRGNGNDKQERVSSDENMHTRPILRRSPWL
jgi:hypothetical protein